MDKHPYYDNKSKRDSYTIASIALTASIIMAVILTIWSLVNGINI